MRIIGSDVSHLRGLSEWQVMQQPQMTLKSYWLLFFYCLLVAYYYFITGLFIIPTTCPSWADCDSLPCGLPLGSRLTNSLYLEHC